MKAARQSFGRSAAPLALAAIIACAGPASALAAPAVSQCIRFDLIDHTHVVDDSTVLFYLRGGKVLENKLDFPCNGLRFNTSGISYVVRGDEVCGNLQLFKVRDTGNICSLGAFAAYTPPPPSPVAH